VDTENSPACTPLFENSSRIRLWHPSLLNVVKRYGHGPRPTCQVIHGVNADIADGEFIVIVGPFGLRQVHAAAHGGRAWKKSPAATSAIGGAWSTTWSPPSATSPWCSRTTRSTRT
jgi:hypothetical protein